MNKPTTIVLIGLLAALVAAPTGSAVRVTTYVEAGATCNANIGNPSSTQCQAEVIVCVSSVCVAHVEPSVGPLDDLVGVP